MCQQQFYFYPRSPCGERQCARGPLRAGGHFYPRSPCGERQCADHATQPVQPISIHALLAESDIDAAVEVAHIRNFYPRSPCGERRGCTTTARIIPSFLSTLSLRRATGQICRSTSKQSRFLSTLSLRRATACGGVSSSHRRHFYPRSPCGERLDTAFTVTWLKPFLSTLSLRRATGSNEGGKDADNNFYPRSPCGERHTVSTPDIPKEQFLSTLSLRRATSSFRFLWC